MDSIKIGKLIAKLRKEKDLTQQQLGDIMGVTDRAVSKWERGLSVPDIANINRLSTFLGISSDELLAGELKENDNDIIEENIKANNEENIEGQPEEIPDNNTKKLFTTYIKFIIIPIIILISIISILILNNNKTYVYDMVSTDPSYTVDGKVIFEKNKISIIVNKIRFEDNEFNKTKIKNYEYDIKVDNNLIFRYGYVYGIIAIEQNKTIDELTEEFSINHNVSTKLRRKEIINENLSIKFTFLDEKNVEIFKLSNGEANFLTNCLKGEGLLKVGGDTAIIQIRPTKREFEFVETNLNKLTRMHEMKKESI